MPAQFPTRSNIPEDRRVVVRFSGGNGADLTVDEGVAGVTAVRSGEGAYTLTVSGWNPGTFKTWSWALGAATPGDVKGHTVVRDNDFAYSATTGKWTMSFVVYDSTFTADDLLVNEYLDLELVFGVAE